MGQAINPYQSASAVHDDRTRLTFDSIIEPRDYAELLPHRDREVILVRTLVGLLMFVSLLIAVGITVGLALRGWDNVVVPAMVLSVLIFLGASIFAWYFRTSQRAYRQLKRHPDLLSIARGELSELGISFHDGTRQHWFGPQYLVNAVVSNDGVRVYVDQNAYRYLALTSRMFDGYNADVAERLRLQWCSASSHATDPATPVGIESWMALNPTSVDAIEFVGTVTITQSLRTPANRKAAIIESVSVAMLIAMGVFANGVHQPWLGISFIGYSLFVLYFNVRRWWNYFRGNEVQSWWQRGWVSPREIAILIHNRGVRYLLDEVATYSDYGKLILFTTRNSTTSYLLREHVTSDTQWIELCALIARHNGDEATPSQSTVRAIGSSSSNV